MRLYLDDDSIDPVLVRLLRQAGHDVMLPADLGNSGAHDAVHLRHAIREDRALLTRNVNDFRFLHDLVLESLGHHPGVLAICQENSPQRDMKPNHIVRAIGKLIASGAPIENEYIVLNHWR